MNSREKLLSKSNLLRGLQCEKSLFLKLYHPELESEVSDSQRDIFTKGHEVGEKAWALFPGGVLIKAAYNEIDLALEQTQKHLRLDTPALFEATFCSDGLLAKVDILKGDGTNWEIIEVKSSTSVKPEHLLDLAIQKKIVENSGLNVSKTYLLFLNREATYPKLENLFIQKDVTEEINTLKTEVDKSISHLKEVIQKDKVPEIKIGAYCDTPYPCSFKAHCWNHLPEENIFKFPRIYKVVWDYYQKNIVSIHDKNFGPFEGIQQKWLEAIQQKKRWIDLDSILKTQTQWEGPLYYLDFETIGPAIPRHEGTRPYQQVPFQFSCLYEKDRGEKLMSSGYLHCENTDPRTSLIEALLKAISQEGKIVAYNMAFEDRCLKEMADTFPKYANALNSLRSRLIDPLPLLRLAVYDPAFQGSFSIKTVAPALLGESFQYKNMKISEGSAASRSFFELAAPTTSEIRKKELQKNLIEYCYQDTAAMVGIVNWIYSLSR